MNNYFEYQDFAKVDRDKIALSTATPLQAGADIEQLREGVKGYDYASFEPDSYITSSPKTLAPKTKKMGVLTAGLSDSDGGCNVSITIDLVNNYSVPGITLGIVNSLAKVNVKYLGSDSAVLRDETFEGEYNADELHFFNVASEGVRTVIVTILQTLEPMRFVGIYKLDLGFARVFDGRNLISATVDSFYNKKSDALEYDVLDMTIFKDEDTEYIFNKNQPIVYKNSEGETINKFFIETGETTNGYQIKIKAYDNIVNLEDNFMGGIYGFDDVYTGEPRPAYPINNLIADILEGTDIEYECIGTENISVRGYLPIDTRRNSLVTALKGSNVRCYKMGGKLIFKPLNVSESVQYDTHNIVKNTKASEVSKIGRLTFTHYTYEKGTDAVELFSGNLEQGENTEQIIEFDEPVWRITAYEVTGIDPKTGEDIVSETESQNVAFAVLPQDEGDEEVCNYAEVLYCRTSNKIVIKGYPIIEAGREFEINLAEKDQNATYQEVVVDDVTVVHIPDYVAKILFAIEHQNKTHSINVLQEDSYPIVGGNVKTPFNERWHTVSVVDEKNVVSDVSIYSKITKIKDNLNGVYEVTIS